MTDTTMVPKETNSIPLHYQALIGFMFATVAFFTVGGYHWLPVMPTLW